MDDLKLYEQIKSVKWACQYGKEMVSDDIGREFGLDKCVKATFKRGKEWWLKEPNWTGTMSYRTEPEAAYTYHIPWYRGSREGTEHHKMKAHIKKE